MHRKSKEAPTPPHYSTTQDSDQALARLAEAEQLVNSLDRQLQSDSNQDLMASMFAHEVNNLMAQVGGRSQLALMNPQRPDLVLKALEIACSASSQVAQLSEFFLGSRASVSSSQSIHSVESVYLRALDHLSDHQTNRYCFVYKQANAQTKTSVSPILLQQILLNLFLNSVRAIEANIDCDAQIVTTSVEHIKTELDTDVSESTGSKSGGAEEQSSTWNNSTIQITIEDTGVGMTQDQIRKILDQPSQSDDSSTQNGIANKSSMSQGHGLGLAVCKELIAHANGSLIIESQPGLGTKMIIRFPELFETND